MISKLVSALIGLVGLACFVYVFFFVPIGRRTLYEHARNIAGTPQAQELGDDVSDATHRVTDRVQQEWDARPGDGGILTLPSMPASPSLPTSGH